MRLFITFLFVAFLIPVAAQVKVDAKATGKHARAIDQAKQSREEAKARKQQAKETKKKLKEQKNARKEFKKRYEKLRKQRMDSLTTINGEVPQLSKEDSLAITREVLAQADFPPEYKDLIINPYEPELPTLNTQNADSIALQKGTNLAEQVAKEYMPDELETEDPLQGLTDPADQLPFKSPTKPNPNLIKPEAARELFKKIDPEQFQDAQAQMQKLKKKYSKLPDTRYPEEGTKRNSLEKLTFAKRLYFGGNLSLQSTDPLILDSNLQLGYWINRKWLAGVGFILREQFNNEDTTSLVTGDGHGYSLFTRYDIPKGFFAWAECEWQVNQSFFGAEKEGSNPTWQQGYLLGIGREFKIGKVQMMSLILYDFNYQNNDLHARPLVFKVGVRFSKKP